MDLLLSQDPAQAGYPAADERVSRLWFKLGFPSAPDAWHLSLCLDNILICNQLVTLQDRKLRYHRVNRSI
jgi:hypothetical protein